jgi:hypothetical protein
MRRIPAPFFYDEDFALGLQVSKRDAQNQLIRSLLCCSGHMYSKSPPEDQSYRALTRLLGREGSSLECRMGVREQSLTL